MKQDHLDGRQERGFGRLRLAEHPPREVGFADIQLPGELLYAANDQASTVQRASVYARVLRRRQGAVGCGSASHQRYRAAFSAHAQVAIIEFVLSPFGWRASNRVRTLPHGRYSGIDGPLLVPGGAAKSCWAVANLTKTRAIRMAADKLGGPRKLREFLGATSAEVAAWLGGIEEPPAPVFLRALTVILDELDRSRQP